VEEETNLIGPTVWEELGPIPIENKSKVEITACSALGGNPTLLASGIGGRWMLVEGSARAELEDEVEV
jgi:hypothetical protein